MFDETAGTNNQRPEQATFARTGQAFLSDITFNFNNRENSAKSIQLAGTGSLERVATVESQVVAVNAYTKGQFVRLFLGSDNSAVPAKVIAAAMQLSLHVSLTLEDATTKDTTGDWVVQEPTAISYDISTTALVRTTETISSDVQAQALADVEEIYEAGTPVRWQIANTSGDNQRTKDTVIASGSCIITQLTINGANRQNADYTAQLSGYGELIVAA
jgi:predicted secreted protein